MLEGLSWCREDSVVVSRLSRESAFGDAFVKTRCGYGIICGVSEAKIGCVDNAVAVPLTELAW